VRRQTDSSFNFERRSETTIESKPISSWVADLRGFELVRVIDENVNLRIEICRHRVTGQEIAVKCFPKLDSSQEEVFFREIEALARLSHRCIVPFFGYVLKTISAGPKIATEFMSFGSLNDVIKTSPSWWDGTTKSIVVAGIVLGMIAIHESGILHRDLKPSNVLIDSEHRPRICDFGSSREKSLSRTLTGGSQVGTPLYMAPDLYEEHEYDEKVDVYSFSLIFYEILVGTPVFSPGLNQMQLVRKIAMNERPNIPNDVFGFVSNLIRRGWSSNPSDRPSFKDIYKELEAHQFIVVSGRCDCKAVESYLGWAMAD
jgi:serine/threonine protein kinase